VKCVAWTEEEKNILRENWKGRNFMDDLSRLLPNRTMEAIRSAGKRMKCHKNHKITPWVAIQEVLEDKKPRCIDELISETGYSEKAIRTAIRMYFDDGIYVRKWHREKEGDKWRPFFLVGRGKSVSKPAKIPNYIAQRKYRERLKKEPERLAKVEARRKFRDRGGVQVKPDIAAAWMFN